ncbi:MAG TPA: flagellar hook protein FlgE [Chloroflexota bacterium]|nr:flagellar hook protein FlgE [Chloroflexota bacterium]
MPRAIWSSVSGLENHQTWMDVLGNNISNLNTVGFKHGRFEFEDILSQSMRGSAPPALGGIGGTNPEQVGLGTTTGSVETITLQGSLQPTNVPTDIAIAGNGYYILSDGTNTHFTRDSVFHVDAAGNVVSAANGLHLQGITADQAGNLQFNRGLQNLTIPQTVNAANNTTAFDVFGNLNSQATNPVQQQVQVFDSLGQQHTIVLTFTPNPAGSGNWTTTATGSDLAGGAAITVTNGNLTFNANGQLTSNGTLTLGFTGTPWVLPGTTTQSNATQANSNLVMNDAAVGNLTSFAAPTAVSSQGAPTNPAGVGNSAGFLKSFSVGQEGIIRGTYSNGTTKTLGQIELATFTNPGGLTRIGQNDFDLSSNSGQANISNPGAGSAGQVVQGSVETSNVDLADQMAQVILAQRGFSANSRLITTSDEMLQDVVAMKR